MKISSKGRCALALAVVLARHYQGGKYVTALEISDELGLSKNYMEQVFSFLKRAGIVASIKGAQGGYRLSGDPGQLTALDVLSAAESSLFEETEDTVRGKAPDVEAALYSLVYRPMDAVMKDTLAAITLGMLADETERNRKDSTLMYYI